MGLAKILGEQKVAITDEFINVSKLLGDAPWLPPPQVYAYAFHNS